ncbi:MAG: carbohydrate kinase family protein [Gemmatimonadetes bacterium]|nr:carbohydrate kinase family protein [Gemmatimonadota bacterium]
MSKPTRALDGRARDTRVLGVVGTLVWDTIHYRDGRQGPIEEWGGIGYALEALSASLPPGWTILPLLKVGKDKAEDAFRFLRGLAGVEAEPGVHVVPEPHNRVDLRYFGQLREAERLTGGVPPWEWPELGPLTALCDALYVNFISGFEMDLETARVLRAAFGGPIYADLHSLFLGIGRHGDRVPRPLEHSAEWLQSFDAVQMNEGEFDVLGRVHGDPWSLAASVVGADLKLITVTLGPRGAAYIASAAFVVDPFAWPRTRGQIAVPGPVRSGKVASEEEIVDGDPTGCGDVWGATFFSRLLTGDRIEAAMGTANRWAARNLEHRGAGGLGLHLAGRVEGSARTAQRNATEGGAGGGVGDRGRPA